jgi:hypothetical protein
MTVPPRIDDTDMILSEVIRRFELLGAVASEEFVEKFTENQLLSATDLLGAVSPAPNDIDRLEFAVFWDMFARMKRVVKNWQDGVNGKFEVKVKEENKEWMLKLMEETNEMLRYWDSVFED